MKLNLILVLAVCGLVGGCRPSAPREESTRSRPEKAKPNREHLRRAMGNIRSYLSALEGRLRVSNAETWSHEAAAAQGDLGNIRIEVGTLKGDSLNVGTLESLLSDLEGRLRGANAENWGQNAPGAQQIVGSIQMELQGLSRQL